MPGLATEFDLSEVTRLNRSYEGYRLALLQWADFAEDGGLGYQAGLRELAGAEKPRSVTESARRPMRFRKYPHHYGWAFFELGPCLDRRYDLDWNLLPYMRCHMIREDYAQMTVIHLKYLTFLDAVREAARAVVRAEQEKNPWPPS